MTAAALFIGHGSPMNAIENNSTSQAWRALAEQMPKPKAILIVSAHWYLPHTAVTTNITPETIHDFGGFPAPLYEVQYPAPGSPELAEQVIQLLAPELQIYPDQTWGLDHGSWSILRHIYPNADIPVVQLSVAANKPADYHYHLGKQLAPLRDQGIAIIGSGNVVHNLSHYDWRNQRGEPYPWASEFAQKVQQAITRGEHKKLIHWQTLSQQADLAVPTEEHYLPLLYVLGSAAKDDSLSFPVEHIEGASISMLSVLFR